MDWIRKSSLAVALSMVVTGLALGGRTAAQTPGSPAPGGAGGVPEPLPTQEKTEEPGGEAREDVPVPPAVSPPSILRPEVQPIDLNTALRLAGVQNPELNVARRRVLESVALRQLAAAQFLPSLNPGMNYDTHTGNLQQSNGNILSVNRSAVYVGAGSTAIAAGSVAVPGVFLGGNTAIGVFGYLTSRQLVRQREYSNIAVRNQVFLKVTLAYSELLRAEGRLAVANQAADEVREIARLTGEYARAGQGRLADANRAASERQRRETYLKQVEAEVIAASAQLCELLNLDPSIRLHPTDAWVVPHQLVPDPIPIAELVALGLLRRPELAAQRASIIQGMLLLSGAKALPFSPTILLGFSAGGFGGGSNLVRPIFGGFGGRTDFDVAAFWTIRNLGVGNVALIRLANANLQVRRFEQLEALNMVRAEIAEAYAKTHARYAQIATNESAVKSGLLSFTQDMQRIRFRGTREVLPIELLDSFRLVADARIDYVDSIVDYNEGQFEMYVALGQPPADALARPVPTAGVSPSGIGIDPNRPAMEPNLGLPPVAPASPPSPSGPGPVVPPGPNVGNPPAPGVASGTAPSAPLSSTPRVSHLDGPGQFMQPGRGVELMPKPNVAAASTTGFAIQPPAAPPSPPSSRLAAGSGPGFAILPPAGGAGASAPRIANTSPPGVAGLPAAGLASSPRPGEPVRPVRFDPAGEPTTSGLRRADGTTGR
jgi:outer membrane protein TolC